MTPIRCSAALPTERFIPISETYHMSSKHQGHHFLYQHIDISTARPTSQYRSFICQRYIDWNRKPLYVAKYCLFVVTWCYATVSHTYLSASLMLFTHTAKNAVPLVSSTDEPMLYFATDLFLSTCIFQVFFFR